MRDQELDLKQGVSLLARLKTTKENEIDYHYLLPNAIRKLLEIFAAFRFPNVSGFANALTSQHDDLKGKLNINALERLVQIESHGTIDGLSKLPALTIEEARGASKAAMEFIAALAPCHYERMQECLTKADKKKSK